MKVSLGTKLIVPAILLGLIAAVPAYAQSSNTPASESMNSAGENAANAAKDAYKGTATALSDTTITAKVKIALDKDPVTKGEDIHVDTVAGVVTLNGNVKTSTDKHRAELITSSTSGVRSVVNDLAVVPPAGSASSGS